MIDSKFKLKEYLDADSDWYGKVPNLKDRILKNEKWYIWQYVKSLRHVEYYINTNQRNSLRFLYWWYKYKHYGFITHITIFPNTCGKGLRIYHIGDMIWIKEKAHIGNNCQLRPGVVLGNKGCNNDPEIIVGDNVDFGLGVKCFGPVKIGDNVTIGAMSVVTKDIPDNCVIAGIPAKILKIKE